MGIMDYLHVPVAPGRVGRDSVASGGVGTAPHGRELPDVGARPEVSPLEEFWLSSMQGHGFLAI